MNGPCPGEGPHPAFDLPAGKSMRIIKSLRADQDLIARFLAVLGRGLGIASHSRSARPGFFIFASNFIQEYLEAEYFKKEAVLLRALEDCGFAPNQGPVGNMHLGHQKSREVSVILSEAARQWQAGDDSGRAQVIWATSEFTGILRRHLDLLKNLIYPLLEQSLSEEDEQKVAGELNLIGFKVANPNSPDRYAKILDSLEEEVGEWQEK